MRKIMMHQTATKPVYVALSEDVQFHVLYEDTSMSSHHSIGEAVRAAGDQCVLGVSGNVLDWEVLVLTA